MDLSQLIGTCSAAHTEAGITYELSERAFNLLYKYDSQLKRNISQELFTDHLAKAILNLKKLSAVICVLRETVEEIIPGSKSEGDESTQERSGETRQYKVLEQDIRSAWAVIEESLRIYESFKGIKAGHDQQPDRSSELNEDILIHSMDKIKKIFNKVAETPHIGKICLKLIEKNHWHHMGITRTSKDAEDFVQVWIL